MVFVHVLVEAVVVGDQLVLALVVGLLREVEVLEGRDVGLATWEADWSHLDLPSLLVVPQDLADVRMHLELVEEHLIGP